MRWRMTVDALLAIDLIAVMATALVQEAPHEWLGLSLFALAVAHIALNRRWFRGLWGSRWTAMRVVRVVSITGAALCMLGLMTSSLVLSRHALWFLPALPGAALARRAHMLCSYWCFVLAFVHAGLQVRPMLARLGNAFGNRPKAIAALRALWLMVALYGMVSFVRLDLWRYLLGRAAFASADFSAPLALALARWASIAVLVAGLAHLGDTWSSSREGDK